MSDSNNTRHSCCTVCRYTELSSIQFDLVNENPMCAFCAAYFLSGDDVAAFAKASRKMSNDLSDFELLGAFGEFTSGVLNFYNGLSHRFLEAKVCSGQMMREALKSYVLCDDAGFQEVRDMADVALQNQASDWIWEWLLWKNILADVEVAAVLTDAHNSEIEVGPTQALLSKLEVNRIWSLWLFSNYPRGKAVEHGATNWHWEGTRYLGNLELILDAKD